MDLDPVDRITADAIGPPGQRVFYIQATQGPSTVSVLVEKQQVQLLASSILEVLSRIERETGAGPEEADMGLVEPVEPIWRAERLSIGYEEERDLMLIEMEELLPGTDEGELFAEATGEELARDAGESPEPGRLRLWGTREQMLALSRHGAMVCERGRPACEFCGNPVDPDGHTCPATNGHRKLGED